MKFKISLLALLLLLFSVRSVSAQSINEIINENLQESTEEFVQETQKDIETYAIDTAQTYKKSFLNTFRDYVRLSVLTEYMKNLLHQTFPHTKNIFFQ